MFKRMLFALPVFFFRRSFIGGLISFFLLKKLTEKDSGRSMSSSSRGQYS